MRGQVRMRPLLNVKPKAWRRGAFFVSRFVCYVPMKFVFIGEDGMKIEIPPNFVL